MPAGGRPPIALVQEVSGVDAVAAALVVDYLRPAGPRWAGVLPTHDDIVFERFFDETGGMQLIVHAPLGARVNRALGLGLRKKFCLNFDFELQAAASNDAALLSLGPQHSFPLEDVPAFLRSHNVQDAVSQAVLRSPMFTARWRWNLNRSLAVLRRKGGRLNPFNIQRMEADDLMAAVFPDLAACQDNAPAGPTEIPDHPLVRETMGDCLNEAMDIDGLKALVRRFEEGTVRLHFVDTVEPSVLAHEILNGAPFTYLDEDTEIGERRSRAVPLRRGLPVEPRELGRLDPDAIERVRAEATPDVRDADELHDVLLSLVAARPREEWAEAFRNPGEGGPVVSRCTAGTDVLWAATERRAEVEALFPGARFVPDHPLPPGLPAVLDAAAADEAAVTPDPGPSRRLRSRHRGRSRRRHRPVAVLGHHRPRGPAGTRVRGRRAVRARAGRAVVRPPAAGPHPRLHPRAQAGRGPSHQPGGVAGLPPVLVARRSRDPSPRQGRTGRGDRTAPGLRVAGRGLGAALRRARRVVSPRMARRPVPVGRGGVGPAVPGRAGRRERRSRGRRAAPLGQDAVPPDAHHLHAAAGSALAPPGPPRRRGAGRAHRRLRAGGARRACAGAAPCSTPTSRPSPVASPPRSRKACGTASPGD